VVDSTFNKFGKKLPPVKTGQRFGEETTKNKKVGLFSERRFLIFTKKGPFEITFKPIHYTSVIISTVVGLSSILYWSVKAIDSAIDVAKKDIITEASANLTSPIENDSDTIVNTITSDQTNISLPNIKNIIKDKLNGYHNYVSFENKLSIKKSIDKIKKNDRLIKDDFENKNDKQLKLKNSNRNQDIITSNLGEYDNIYDDIKSEKNNKLPQPPKLNAKAKSLRFLASVDNELILLENVFKSINVELSNSDMVSVSSIINKEVDLDSDDLFTSLKDRLNLLGTYKDALQFIPLKPPMEHYYISSHYGKRKHPVTGKYRMHHGIDLAGTWQEDVSVSADGTVIFAGYHGSFGKVIRISHSYGINTTYGHLAKIKVKKGDIVSEGQVIGKMGRTGRVKGAHLHYEISVNGKSQNPINFIKIGRNLLSRTSIKGFANIE
jgi:murein DD-endopeptidase MepM/ murein hydrolase activator NlpD